MEDDESRVRDIYTGLGIGNSMDGFLLQAHPGKQSWGGGSIGVDLRGGGDVQERILLICRGQGEDSTSCEAMSGSTVCIVVIAATVKPIVYERTGQG